MQLLSFVSPGEEASTGETCALAGSATKPVSVARGIHMHTTCTSHQHHRHTRTEKGTERGEGMGKRERERERVLGRPLTLA
eukprot:COSAG01_NODE_3515_length_5982_cov_4.429883_4_plen_81_part_00